MLSSLIPFSCRFKQLACTTSALSFVAVKSGLTLRSSAHTDCLQELGKKFLKHIKSESPALSPFLVAVLLVISRSLC